jgi:tight adherence protein B
MSLMFYVFAVLVFAAVILLIEGAYMWWLGSRGGAAQRMERCLRLMSGSGGGAHEAVSILKQRRFSASPWLNALLLRIPRAAAIDRLLLQAGLTWSVAQFLAFSLTLVALGLGLLLVMNMPPPVAVAVSLLCLAGPYLHLLRARARRLKSIEAQLPEAADLMVRALRAGHAFSNALQMLGADLPEPLAGEFRTVSQEINYGVSMNDALQNLAARVPLTDLRYLVIALLIQRESGGNLAELLGNIARIIRERLKLMGQVRVMTAEGRLSAWILSLMPGGVMIMMSIINPDYISVLWTEPKGIRILWTGAGMIILGIFWMRALIRIRV